MFTFLNVVVSIEKLNTSQYFLNTFSILSQYFLNHFSMFSQYAFHLNITFCPQCFSMRYNDNAVSENSRAVRKTAICSEKNVRSAVFRVDASTPAALYYTIPFHTHCRLFSMFSEDFI